MITVSIALALCPAPPIKRVSCVVDGDTVWVNREKIRLSGIDAPEIRGKCPSERHRAILARNRLITLLADGFAFERVGIDRFDRTLARLSVNGRDVGELLVSGGHARHWTGRRESWCS